MAAALTVCLLSSTPSQAAGGHWTVSAVDGTVMVTASGGGSYPASQGQPVAAGSTIVTEDDSAVFLTRRGDSITVYPNSEMTIPATSTANEPGVLQGIGRLLFRMETRESRDFEVRTPFLAATIKGTTFTVVVEQTRATVSVAEGLVRVEAAQGGRSEMVRPGWTARVEVDREFVDLARRRKSQTDDAVETGDSVSGNPKSGSSLDGYSQGGDSQGGDSQGGDSQGGYSQGGDSQGGDSQGGDSQGGDSQGGDSQGGDSQGDQQ
jgi:hypothetical protein